MRILWDEPKRHTNLDKHGLDFADLTADFFLEAVVVPGRGARRQAIGSLSGWTIVVVFAPLGNEALSVISMRRANRKDRRLAP
jgi:uncharacterized DUF497 family protein